MFDSSFEIGTEDSAFFHHSISNSISFRESVREFTRREFSYLRPATKERGSVSEPT